MISPVAPRRRPERTQARRALCLLGSTLEDGRALLGSTRRETMEHPTVRKSLITLAALLALAILGLPSFGAEPIAKLFAPGSTALLCPNHPPGYCCSGPPLCRCTPGPCS